MPDPFPPVERRSIVGTGMNADPETIEDLEGEWGRRERANPPKRPFEKVLTEKREKRQSQVPKEKKGK